MSGEDMLIAARNAHPDPLYSNFDHVLNENVRDFLVRHSDTFGKQAAWNFCAWVRFDQYTKEWVSDIYQLGTKIDVIRSDDLEEVIELANERYGYS
jgi:hypothetical protein